MACMVVSLCRAKVMKAAPIFSVVAVHDCTRTGLPHLPLVCMLDISAVTS